LPNPVAEQKPSTVTNTSPSRTTAIPQAADSHNPSVGEILTRTDPIKAKERQEDMAKALESANVPIDFYGRTVDQHGNSLPGVQIEAFVRHWTVSLEGTSLRVDRNCDSNGFFEIHDITGDACDLESMTKDGYEVEANARRTFGPSSGSPGNPILFKMWSKDIKEPLVSGKRSLQLVPDGRMYMIDVTNGTITGSNNLNGDFTLWVKRQSNVTLGQRFDWSCGMQFLNGGGIIEEIDSTSSMYIAPTDGYTNAFHFEVAATRNGWASGTALKRFYIRTKSGTQYGRICIQIYSYYNRVTPGLIRIEYAINPTGSHILR
jgi:hypothetical protein